MATYLCFVSGNFGWNVSVVGQISQCPGYVAQSSADFGAGSSSGSTSGISDMTAALSSALSSIFSTYFDFDQSVFSLIVGFNLIAFVTGYGLRRVIRAMSIL